MIRLLNENSQVTSRVVIDGKVIECKNYFYYINKYTESKTYDYEWSVSEKDSIDVDLKIANLHQEFSLALLKKGTPPTELKWSRINGSLVRYEWSNEANQTLVSFKYRDNSGVSRSSTRVRKEMFYEFKFTENLFYRSSNIKGLGVFKVCLNPVEEFLIQEEEVVLQLRSSVHEKLTNRESILCTLLIL